jgi:hypothetical protein
MGRLEEAHEIIGQLRAITPLIAGLGRLILHATACGGHQIHASSYFFEAASVIKEPRFHGPGRRRSCHLSHSGGFLSVVCRR